MHGWTRRSLVFVVVAVLFCTTTVSSAFAQDTGLEEETSGEEMIGDFVLLRPLGIGATAVGTVFFIVSLPFSAISGSVDLAFQKLVVEPAAFTFTRPLGKVIY